MDVSSISSVAPNVSAPNSAPVAAQDRRTLIQAIRAVNESELFGDYTELTFVVDRATRGAVVRIVDRASREVVEQIPVESVLRMAEDLHSPS